MKQAIEKCPGCGNERITYDGIKRYYCYRCNWEFYQNTAAAVAGIIEYQGKYLAVKRNLEPGKGLMDFPGGFVDPMETAEHALAREIQEELNVKITNWDYLCTAPNLYKYNGIEYSTCDIFYTAHIEHTDFKIDESEIAGIVWRSLEELNPEEFAFRSMKAGIEALKGKFGK